MPETPESDHATVAAVDPEALGTEALAAVVAASSEVEVERVRVEYLGRKSALKLALREVRDRETGMALNALRERARAGGGRAGGGASPRRARPPAGR